jgi:Phospholipase_D-nuclease N-terminal
MDWTFGTVIWSMVVFFFWFIFIWMFISVFSDIFRRDDLSGWGKAGWIFLIVILPFLGILLYMIVRPKMTAQDRRLLGEAQERERRLSGYSPADELAKLSKLQEEGKISPQEYEELKRKVML